MLENERKTEAFSLHCGFLKLQGRTDDEVGRCCKMGQYEEGEWGGGRETEEKVGWVLMGVYVGRLSGGQIGMLFQNGSTQGLG